VDERCLIPRSETEILVEQTLKALGERTGKNFSFLDIGTGSGAIAIAILRAFKNAKGTLLDISADALEVARENLEMLCAGRSRKADPGRSVQAILTRRNMGFDRFEPTLFIRRGVNEIQEELKFEPRGALDGEGKTVWIFIERSSLARKAI